MTLGAEPKKVGWLIGLSVFAVGVYLYMNVFSGPSYDTTSTARAPVKQAAAPDLLSPSRAPAKRPQAASRSGLGTFHPRFREPRPEDRPNLANIDPTLRLDLFAKVRKVSAEGGARNLFAVAGATVPATPIKLAKEPKIPINKLTPPATTVTAGGTPAEPPPPPINLKYYGFSSVRGTDGKKRAFFLDGDDIIVAGENEMIKKRYKVVRIGVNSVQVEDTQYKNTQTLPLQEESVA